MLLLSHFLQEATSCFPQESDGSHRFPMSLRKGSEKEGGSLPELTVGAEAGWCAGCEGVEPSSRRSPEGG